MWNPGSARGPFTVKKRPLVLGIHLPLTGVKIPKIGKRGFRSQKTPISDHPRKGRSEPKNPHFHTEHYKGNGDLWARNTLFWGGGKGGFLTSKPSFPDFGDFDPCNQESAKGAGGKGARVINCHNSSPQTGKQGE